MAKAPSSSTPLADAPTANQPPSEPVLAERLRAGKALRAKTPRSSQGAWKPSSKRPDPIALLRSRDGALLADLLPIRYGRMAQSPLAFLRGAAIVMASDLAATPSSGIRSQICGDAHLMNFGVYATPERELVFGLTDFDESLPGPWEWDLKRLATSILLAGRNRSFPESECEVAAASTVSSYQGHIAGYAHMAYVDVWASRVSDKSIRGVLPSQTYGRAAEHYEQGSQHEHIHQIAKLVSVSDGRPHLVDQPPLIEHASDERVGSQLHTLFTRYHDVLPEDIRALVGRYTLVDSARKVVGVGSVGTRCYVLLLEGLDTSDLQFLQIKEALASVLETPLARSVYAQHGERVVQGQRLLQAAPDMFLGWGEVDKVGYYVRHLAEVKGTVNLQVATPASLAAYGEVCGWALARAHAQSGEAARISGYIGRGEAFVQALTSFAAAYAEQTERDHAQLLAAIKAGHIQAELGV